MDYATGVFPNPFPSETFPAQRPSLLKDIITVVVFNILISLVATVFDYEAPLFALGLRVTFGIVSLAFLFRRHFYFRNASAGATVIVVENQAPSSPSFFPQWFRQPWSSYNSAASSVAGQPMYTPAPRSYSPSAPQYNAMASGVAGQPMFTPAPRIG